MKPRNSGMLEHEVAEIQSAEHVSSFLEHVEFVDDGTVLQNFKVELMARSGAPRRNLIRNCHTLRGSIARIASWWRWRRRWRFRWVTRRRRRHWRWRGVRWIRVFGGWGTHGVRHCDSSKPREVEEKTERVKGMQCENRGKEGAKQGFLLLKI